MKRQPNKRPRAASPSRRKRPPPQPSAGVDTTNASEPSVGQAPPGAVLGTCSHGPEHPPAETRAPVERMRRALQLTPDVPDRQVLAEAAKQLERQ